MILRFPRGYQRLQGITPLAVAHDQVADSVRAILASGTTLFDWAANHLQRWQYNGRGPVYSAPLPDGPRIVVRHARRGGLIGPILRDLYLPPTPAPSELLISAILQQAGVPTPPVLAFATYRAPWPFRRVDIATVEVEGSDLATALANTDHAGRRALTAPVAALVASLTEAGAWHQDLNAKNILIASREGRAPVAVVIDVDRVRFSPGGDPHVRDANLARLRRSIAKARGRNLATFSEDDWSALVAAVAAEEAERARHRQPVMVEDTP